MKDFYGILELEKQSTKEEIKGAYFAAARKFPFDRYEVEFMDIRSAYEVLSNHRTRTEYDEVVLMSNEIKEKYEKASDLIKEGELGSAVKILEEILKDNPKLLIVRALLAEGYLKNNNSGKAIKLYEELAKEEPENAAFSGYLANSYHIRGWQKKAIKAYERALELDVDNISLWIGLCDAHTKDENYDEAKKTIEKSLEAQKEISFIATLYFRLIMLEISFGMNSLISDLTDKLVVLAQNNSKIKEDIAWILCDISRYFMQLGGAEEAKMLNDAAIIILPQDENVLDTKKEIENFNKYADLFDKLSNDDEIKQEIGVLIGLEVLPDSVLDLDEDGKDAMAYYNEYQILSQYDDFKATIQRLRKVYPEFYDLIRDFLDKAANDGERRKMLKGYEKHSDRFFELINGSPDLFKGEEDNSADGQSAPGGIDDDTVVTFVREEPKIGRNDPCTCGSGKKYKKCCGK
ncbi:tetratricopeptide repeat protein [Clostridium fungisolvens]|uniref:Beta-barrel assembly-enhancing protease n=1 Tax=Clostridium fungisolvens TaxID=1604897 RepID=A0A6V8SHB8_9CLOT|nr:tetratricopeptide repeat protein [Clostridium fungisolvens]GFP76567.1 Beta-barrel assembly-enhancing protease [Clostridium fungisolvens]